MQGWVCSLSVVNSLHSKQLESPPNSLCCAGGAGGLCGMGKYRTPSQTLCAAGVSRWYSAPHSLKQVWV